MAQRVPEGADTRERCRSPMGPDRPRYRLVSARRGSMLCLPHTPAGCFCSRIGRMGLLSDGTPTDSSTFAWRMRVDSLLSRAGLSCACASPKTVSGRRRPAPRPPIQSCSPTATVFRTIAQGSGPREGSSSSSRCASSSRHGTPLPHPGALCLGKGFCTRCRSGRWAHHHQKLPPRAERPNTTGAIE